MSNVGQLGFRHELKIPPLLEPRLDRAGRKVFDLQLQTGTSELLPGKPTETWGANGTYLGPTLRATRGDEVAINIANDLPEPTTIHWHGMHLRSPPRGRWCWWEDRAVAGSWGPAAPSERSWCRRS